MRGTGKFLLILGSVLALLLLYVNAQISLFQVSYKMASIEHQIVVKREQYQSLKFDVERLKAPRLLEEKMKELQLNLSLPSEIRVVRVPQIEEIDSRALESASLTPFSHSLMDFFGRWVKVAQAKTES